MLRRVNASTFSKHGRCCFAFLIVCSSLFYCTGRHITAPDAMLLLFSYNRSVRAMGSGEWSPQAFKAAENPAQWRFSISLCLSRSPASRIGDGTQVHSMQGVVVVVVTSEREGLFHIRLVCPWKLMAGGSFALDMQSRERRAAVGSLTYYSALCCLCRRKQQRTSPPALLAAAAATTLLEESCEVVISPRSRCCVLLLRPHMFGSLQPAVTPPPQTHPFSRRGDCE